MALLLQESWGPLRALGQAIATQGQQLLEALLRGHGALCSLACFMKDCMLSVLSRKPWSAYLPFTMKVSPMLRAQKLHLRNTEVVKKLAETLRELPDSQKEIYEKATNSELKIYKEEKAKYMAELSPDQKKILMEEKHQKRNKKQRIKRKREFSAFGQPTKPHAGYNIFVSEHFNEIKGSIKERMKLSQEWKNLSSSRKQVYLQCAKDDKIHYANEIKSWEENMFEIGLEDVLSFTQPRPKVGRKPKYTS